MEKFDPIDIEFLINKEQVAKDAERVKNNLTQIGYTAEEARAKVNAKIKTLLTGQAFKELNVDLKNQGNHLVKNRRQWNGLGNSINQLTREIPAFSVNAQTGFLAISNNIPILADEISRLRQKNDALVASGQKGVPIWKQLAKGFFSWNTLMSVGVVLLTIYGKDLVNWVQALFKGKKALDELKLSKEAVNKAFESSEYQNTVKDLMQLRSQIDLAKKGFIDKEVALDKYNKTLGEVYEKTNDINVAEQNVINKAPAYIEAMLYKAAAAIATAEAAKKLAEHAKEEIKVEDKIEGANKNLDAEKVARDKSLARIKVGRGTRGDFEKASNVKDTEFYITGLGKELDKLEEKGDEIQAKSQKIVDNLNKKAAKVAAAAGLNVFKSNKNITSAVNARQTLLDRLSAIDKEYARKSFTKDEEELQALRDKFAAIREKIERFNNDPKNKGQQIDLSGFGELEEKAVRELGYRQDTEKIAEDLAEKRQVFADFEQAKKELGIEKANEMYADQMEGFDTYLEYVQNQAWQNEAAYKAVANGTATGGQNERVKLFEDEQKEEETNQKNKFIRLLASLQSYEQKRKLLIEQYTEERAQLIANGNQEEAEELDRHHKENIDNLDKNYAKGTDEYKALIQGVEDLSTTAARTVVRNARAMVAALIAAGKLSEEAAKEINAKIDAFEEDINEGVAGKLGAIAQGASKISGAFYELGDSVGYFDESLGDSLSTMGDLASVIAQGASAAASFASGDIIGGISSTISAISGIFNIARKAKESERKANEELLRINNALEDGERRILAIQRQRNIEKAEELGLTLKGIEAQRETMRLSAAANQQEQEALKKELQSLEYISGSRKEKYGGFLGIGEKTRVVNEYSSLMGVTIDEMEAMYEKGQLDGRAKELFEQLKTLQAEGKNIHAMIDDLNAKTQALFTGTTSNAISDSIIDGLSNGYTSFQNFAGDVERILQGAILNGVNLQMLKEPMEKLYAEFAKDAESGGELTAEEAQKFRDNYQALQEAAVERYEQLSGVLDKDLLEDSGQGLIGGIRRELTEETGTILTGLWRGTFDITKMHKQIAQEHLDVAKRTYDILNRMYEVVIKNERNTANTVIELRAAVAELKQINTNTTPATGRDIGYGV